MPRAARIIIPDAIYHILNRGNNKEVVFFDDEDFRFFLRQIKKYKERFGMKIYHYCLMPNHCHFLAQPSTPRNLAKFMHAIMLVHAQYLQRKYNKVGHIWQGRYKSPAVEKEDYLLKCGYYIEDNPRRAGLVKSLKDWPWSSYYFYAYGNFDPVIDVDEDYLKLGRTPAERQLNYRERMMETQNEKWILTIREELDQGILGSEEFIKGIVEKFKVKLKGIKKRGRPPKS